MSEESLKDCHGVPCHSGKWHGGVVMGCFHLLSDCIFTVVVLSFFRSWIFVVPVF